MKPLRVGLDVDGVLACFNDAFTSVTRELYGKPPVGHEPGDWHYSDSGLSSEQIAAAFRTIHDIENFWLSLKPYEDSLEALRCFVARHASDTELFFVTARQPSAGASVSQQTLQWLYRQGVITDKLHVLAVTDTSSKVAFYSAASIRLSLDDKPFTVRSCLGSHGHTPYLLRRRWSEKERHGLLTVASVEEYLSIVGRRIHGETF